MVEHRPGIAYVLSIDIRSAQGSKRLPRLGKWGGSEAIKPWRGEEY